MANSSIKAESFVKTVKIPKDRLTESGGGALWHYARVGNLSDLIPTGAKIISVFRGNWGSAQDGVPYCYNDLVGVAYQTAIKSNDIDLFVSYTLGGG